MYVMGLFTWDTLTKRSAKVEVLRPATVNIASGEAPIACGRKWKNLAFESFEGRFPVVMKRALSEVAELARRTLWT
jgi:hypothetical protein